MVQRLKRGKMVIFFFIEEYFHFLNLFLIMLLSVECFKIDFFVCRNHAELFGFEFTHRIPEGAVENLSVHQLGPCSKCSDSKLAIAAD